MPRNRRNSLYNIHIQTVITFRSRVVSLLSPSAAFFFWLSAGLPPITAAALLSAWSRLLPASASTAPCCFIHNVINATHHAAKPQNQNSTAFAGKQIKRQSSKHTREHEPTCLTFSFNKTRIILASFSSRPLPNHPLLSSPSASSFSSARDCCCLFRTEGPP